jgi:hypothetical protein
MSVHYEYFAATIKIMVLSGQKASLNRQFVSTIPTGIDQYRLEIYPFLVD